jgi:aryl-alcohol dehydrogenase-like predicted oxidoreductase
MQARKAAPLIRIGGQAGQDRLKFTGRSGTGMRDSSPVQSDTAGKEEFEKLIRTSYERGVRWYDMADLYGSHPYVVPALKGIKREKYSLVTKVWFYAQWHSETERPDAMWWSSDFKGNSNRLYRFAADSLHDRQGLDHQI